MSYVTWLRSLSEQGGKGVINNIDARCLGRIADELESLKTELVGVKALHESAVTAWIQASKDRDEARKQLDCMQSAIRDAFYAGYFEGRPPIAINGVDRAVREEEAAWKEYADREGIPLAEEHKPGCQSGDFGPCDCKLSDDFHPPQEDDPNLPEKPLD